MNYLVWLVPIALGMGLAGLAAFLWSMRAGQYDDLSGAAERVLMPDADDAPLLREAWDEQPGRLYSKREGEESQEGRRMVCPRDIRRET